MVNPSRKLNVALFGTMKTLWRVQAKHRLRALGHESLDNTNTRWLTARTAEEIEPLLKQDHDLMAAADVVIWHHDRGTPGSTARFELGYLTPVGPPVIVHVARGVSSRNYMKALTRLYPRLHWAESWRDVYELLQKLAAAQE